MSSKSTENVDGASNVDNQEEASKKVASMDVGNCKNEVFETTDHEQEASNESPVIKDCEDASVVTSVVGAEELLTTKTQEKDCVSVNTSDCDGEMDVCVPSETVSNQAVGEPNSESELMMDTVNTENKADMLDSPEKPNSAERNEILSSTPTKATETYSVQVSNSPSDCPVEIKISDDDDDIAEFENGTEQTFKGAHRGIVVPYSDTDSDSSSSSDSDDESETSSDSSSPDSDVNTNSTATRNKSSSDPKPVKVRGELDIEDLPPIQDLHISVRDDQAVEIGKVLHAVDTLVVVECYKDQPPLDIDSVLFLDKGARPLGRIFDVMGPVTEPLYCVRFNSKEHIEEQNIEAGMLVYSAPQTEHSQFVFVKHLMMMKGSDASWKKDKEVPCTEVDFSDDEVEAEIRKTSNNRTGNSPQNWDEPRRKMPKPNQNEAGGRFQSNGFQGNPRGQGRDNYRPRNPWGWSGARFNVPGNNQCPPPNHPNQFAGRGFVRAPSFNTEPSLQTRPPHRNVHNNQYMHSSNTQYRQDSASDNYGPSPEYSSYQQGSNDYAPGNGYSYGNEYSHGMDYSHGQDAYPPHNTPDHRYQAFQSEIAKLVDAYNRGVDSPMTLATATLGMRPSGPSLAPPQFGGRPPGPRPQFGGRPPGPPPQFGGRPPGPRAQFGGIRAPPQFSSLPAGPPPQFGSRLPGPSYDNHFY